ncbi:MAG TPA: type II secretion system F family protein [Oscillospiraceae bacterium]|nr:type II secretion system F family protein [Oscillospiraceae bacterium]
MTTFAYIVLEPSGKETKGSLAAESREAAMAQLKQGGNTLVSLAEANALNKEVKINLFAKKPKPRDLAVFCRQFVSIVSAGVPVINALGMLEEQTQNKRLAAAARDCRMTIEKGSSLAEAMRKHADIFSDMFVTMVDAGEASGSLDVSFSRMAVQFEKDAKLRGTIKRASIYPIVVVVVTLIVITILLTFVIPSFEGMFSDMGTELPGITKFVIACSVFLRTRWFILLLIVAGIVFGVKYAKKTPKGAHFFGRISLKAPLFGNLHVKTASARMSRTLATLLASGISMMDALDIVAETMDNIYYYEAMKKAREDVSMGTSLSESLERSKMFPPLVYHMLHIGEETGDIDGMLTKIADYYDEEVEMATGQIMAAIEPMIIILLAAIVGTVVFAVIMPMMSMYNALDSL